MKYSLDELLDGQKQFGFLTVIGEGERYIPPGGGPGYLRVICKCICDNERLFSISQLRSGKRLSCGCQNKSFLHRSVKNPSSLTLPKTNKEAAALGLKHYFTGVPCPKGHIAYRWVSNQWCAVCAGDSSRAYRRKYPIKKWVDQTYARSRRWSAENDLPFDLTQEYITSLITTHCPALDIPLIYGAIGKGICDESPTLDRIIPARGYMKGNVVILSHKANRMKSDANAYELQKLTDWLKSIEKGD